MLMMMIRVKQDEDILCEWIGPVPTRSDLPRAVQAVLHAVQARFPEAPLNRLSIFTEKYLTDKCNGHQASEARVVNVQMRLN